MTIKISNLVGWASIPTAAGVLFDGKPGRRVTIEVNCVASTRFDLKLFDENGVESSVFLGVVPLGGYEELSFVAPAANGRVELYADSESDVWWRSDDGQVFFFIDDQEQLTTIANRAARNHDLELMELRMWQNMERRLAKQAETFELIMAQQAEMAEIAQAEALEAGGDADDQGTTDGDAGEEQPAPAKVSRGRKADDKGPDDVSADPSA